MSNDTMRAALLAIMRAADAAKEPCGTDPESQAAIRNSRFATIALMAAQGLGMVSGPALAAQAPQRRCTDRCAAQGCYGFCDDQYAPAPQPRCIVPPALYDAAVAEGMDMGACERFAGPAPQPAHDAWETCRQAVKTAISNRRGQIMTAPTEADLWQEVALAFEALHPSKTAYSSAGEAARPEIDRLNSERLDLACLVLRLIRRMRAARSGKGMAAGDDALEQRARGYLQRKGLSPNALRDGGGGETATPSAGAPASELMAALAKYRQAAAASWQAMGAALGATAEKPASITIPDGLAGPLTDAFNAWRDVERIIDSGYSSVQQPNAGDWQPIETAPKDRVFLGWLRAERWSSADGEGSGRSHDVSQGDFCWWRAVPDSPDGGYFDNGAGQVGDAQEVTHWMPLPAAPEGKQP